jgi:hypothetical protein
MIARLAPLLVVAALSCGCPNEIDSASLAPKSSAKAPVVDESDPRVVRDGEDLYPAASMERAAQTERPTNEAGLGSGKPDESNGECRLFAPKLPDPACCKPQYGFDVETVKKACGLDLFLGESFQYSCGYYFHKTDKPVWMRMGHLPDTDPKASAEAHDKKMRDVTKNPAYASKPVPGVEGALFSAHENNRWAFIPGWTRVRQLSWHTDTCTDEAVFEVIKQLAAAKEPPKNTKRADLVPTASM